MLRVLMESLGPAEFFKTKAEFRFAPKVASGDNFFLQKGGLQISKQINSRRVWEEELTSLQTLKESPRRRRAERQRIDAAIVLQALCRREQHKLTIETLQKAAKLRAAEADMHMPGGDTSDEEDNAAIEQVSESQLEPETRPEPEVASVSAPVGCRRTRAERESMRKKFEAFKATGRPNLGLQLVVNDQPVKDYPRQPSSMKKNGEKKKRDKPNISIRT